MRPPRSPDRLTLALALLFSLPAAAAPDPFTTYLATPFPPADGFDPPLSATEARAPGAGRVLRVTKARGRFAVTVQHVFYENHHKRHATTVIAGLTTVAVRAGQVVTRGAPLGAASETAEPLAPRLIVRLDGRDVDPGAFFAERARLFVPAHEPALVLVDTARYRLRLVATGKTVADYEVGFGQARGCKEREGDLRSPCGMYFVTDKSRGPFPGPYGAYYGGHWMKINYPNAFDADRGRAAGLVSDDVHARIATAWRERAPTAQTTPLGSGIGFHGWAEEWERRDGADLSWGCVVLHLRDVAAFFDRVPRGTMVVIW